MKQLTLALIALVVALSACKRENPAAADEVTIPGTQEHNIAAKDLIVPASFNFDTEKELLVRVKIADAKPGTRYGIRIYADVPSTGKLISSGVTDTKAEYTNTIKIPAWYEHIYIEKIAPGGASSFEKVTANRFATALFKDGSQPQQYIMRKASGLDCSNGCNTTYHNPTTDITIGNNDSACITGTIGSNVKLTMSAGSRVRICASGTFTKMTVTSGATITVLENAVLRINSFTNTGYFIITNWSDSVVIDSTTSWLFNPDLFYNYGKIYTPNFGIGNYGSNYGTHVANGGFGVGGYSQYHNNGYLKVNGDVTNGTLADFFNSCRMEVTGNFRQEGAFYNYSYIKVWGTFDHTTLNTEWPNGTSIGSSGLISTTNFIMGYGTIGSTGGVIKVSNNSTFINGAISGMTFCDADGIETHTGGSYSGATLSCSGYIATSSCNPEGFGSNNSTDSDNDGIDDFIDEYPSDANRAFNSYYPAAGSTATVAFEDLWPSLGDYDFNDMAVAFNIQQILNADNEVVDYKVKLKVKAVGGSFENGLGFQLDGLAPSEISNITGQVLVKNLITRNANNTEAGQAKAVVICFDSPEPVIQRAPGSMFNTIKTNGAGNSDTVRINISFGTPVAASKLTMDKFNPFIFTKQRRGYEVHLPNFKPTSLATLSVLGTFADNSSIPGNVYYKTATGMPWAMLIPENFDYAKEKSAITSAYNYFDDWVISGGSSNTNWYTNNAGNRNSNEVY